MSNENIVVKKKKQFINNSGKGGGYAVPRIVANKFNWGAFFLTWIWGIGNGSYITLWYLILAWIPFVNFAAVIWFGIKGNTWAWQNKHFTSIREFHNYQRNWAIAGLVFTIVMVVLLIFFYSSLIMMFFASGALDMGTGVDTNGLEF